MAVALSTPAEVVAPAEVAPAEVVAPAEPSGPRQARRRRGSRQPRAAAVGKRRRLPWPRSMVPWYMSWYMAPCSSLACLERARHQRAQRKHHSKPAARACTAARRALEAVAAG